MGHISGFRHPAWESVVAVFGFPPGSYGWNENYSRGPEPISPNGIGPDFMPAHYISWGDSGSIDASGKDWSIDQETGVNDWYLTPEQLLRLYPRWVRMVRDDPSYFAADDTAIWQHTAPKTMRAAIALLEGRTED